MQEGSVSPVSDDRHDGSPNIRAVILDYGQVLVRCPTVPEFRRMAEMFHVSFESFYELWEASRDVYDRGDLAAEEHWLRLAEQTNTTLGPGQIEILRPDFNLHVAEDLDLSNTTLAPGQIEILRQVEIEIWAHTDPGM